MQILVEVRWIKEGTEDNEEPEYIKANYYLLHFGIKTDVIPDAEGRLVASSNTVAICQHCETGVVEMFDPTQLRVIGDKRRR